MRDLLSHIYSDQLNSYTVNSRGTYFIPQSYREHTLVMEYILPFLSTRYSWVIVEGKCHIPLMNRNGIIAGMAEHDPTEIPKNAET